MADSLGQVAVVIAYRAAREYLRQHGLTADETALQVCVKSWCKAKAGEALADAEAALKANMPKQAEQTFAASMVIAGIEAAKEAGFPAHA